MSLLTEACWFQTAMPSCIQTTTSLLLFILLVLKQGIYFPHSHIPLPAFSTRGITLLYSFKLEENEALSTRWLSTICYFCIKKTHKKHWCDVFHFVWCISHLKEAKCVGRVWRRSNPEFWNCTTTSLTNSNFWYIQRRWTGSVVLLNRSSIPSLQVAKWITALNLYKGRIFEAFQLLQVSLRVFMKWKKANLALHQNVLYRFF
jgi:hypothetical protein